MAPNERIEKGGSSFEYIFTYTMGYSKFSLLI